MQLHTALGHVRGNIGSSIRTFVFPLASSREKMHVTENDIKATVNNVSPSLKSHIVKIIGERCLVT